MRNFIQVTTEEGKKQLIRTSDIRKVDEQLGEGVEIHLYREELPLYFSNSFAEVMTDIEESDRLIAPRG